MEITVGQELFVKPIGNAARYHKDILKLKVAKVGRKFFEFESSYYGRFSKETLTQDGKGYISNYRCYFSEQEIYDEMEHNELCTKLSRFFAYFNANKLPLEKLRAIDKIISEP